MARPPLLSLCTGMVISTQQHSGARPSRIYLAITAFFLPHYPSVMRLEMAVKVFTIISRHQKDE